MGMDRQYTGGMGGDAGDPGDGYGGDAGGAGEGGFVPSTGQEMGGAGEQQGQPKINLDTLPDFQNYKKTVNQTIAERDRAIREMQRRYDEQLQQTQAELERVRQEMEQQVYSNLDEYGQMEYKAKQEERRRLELEQRLQSIQEEGQKNQYMMTLRERYGVDPTDDSHPVLALQSVTDALLQRNRALEQQLAQYKREADARRAGLDDMPDLGGGAPVHPISDIQRQYNQAMIELRGLDADKLSRMAAEQGIKLDRFSWRKQQQQMQQRQQAQNGGY